MKFSWKESGKSGTLLGITLNPRKLCSVQPINPEIQPLDSYKFERLSTISFLLIRLKTQEMMVRTRLEMQILDHLLVKDRLDIELHGKETNGPHLMMSAVWRIAPLVITLRYQQELLKEIWI